jgi:PAS domain-containing protein
MADPVRPLLDGGASAVEDNKPGRKASGGTRRASRTPGAEPSAASGSPAPLTAKALTDAQSLMADELPDGLVVADDAGRVVVYNRAAVRLTGVGGTHAHGN